MNKKLKLLIFIGMIGMTLCSFGQKFSEEEITEIKIKGNKIFFFKQVIEDSMICIPKAGVKCIVGRQQSLNAEVFEIDTIVMDFAHKLTFKEWSELYYVGKIVRPDKSSEYKIFRNARLDSSSKFYWGNLLLFGTSYNHYFIPSIDKQNGLIYGKKILTTDTPLNIPMLGFLFWFLVIMYHLSHYRRILVYKSKLTDSKNLTIFQAETMKGYKTDDLVASKCLGFLSFSTFLISALIVDEKTFRWNEFGLWMITVFSLLLFLVRYFRKSRSYTWNNQNFFYVELYGLVVLLYLFSLDIFATIYYGAIMFTIFNTVSRRFQKEI